MADYKILPPIKAQDRKIIQAGWVLPNGDFFPAKYTRHSLTAAYYFGTKWLDKAKAEQWVHLDDDGDVTVEGRDDYRDYSLVTQGQVDTLFDISTVRARAQWKVDFKERLTDRIEKILKAKDNDQTHQ